MGFFTATDRSRIVKFILDRQRFTLATHFDENDSKDDFGFGIDRLINDNIYAAAYPLHDVSRLKVYLVLIKLVYYSPYNRVRSMSQEVCAIFCIQNGRAYGNGIVINRWIILMNILVLKLDYISLGLNIIRTCCYWHR